MVKTLSASGASFHATLVSPLQVDDEVTLAFQLDDIWQTVVELRALVRWVHDAMVGAEFCKTLLLDSGVVEFEDGVY